MPFNGRGATSSSAELKIEREKKFYGDCKTKAFFYSFPVYSFGSFFFATPTKVKFKLH